MNSLRRIATAAAIAVAAAAPGAQVAGAAPTALPPSPSQAWFEGRQIDLRHGWGEATACHVVPAGTYCYRSETEMDAHSAADVARAVGGSESAAVCSNPARLYDGTSYGGAVVAISNRGTLEDLTWYGFSNKTSSYKIGACNADLWDGYYSGIYPGATNAGNWGPGMFAGWNNVISFVVQA